MNDLMVFYLRPAVMDEVHRLRDVVHAAVKLSYDYRRLVVILPPIRSLFEMTADKVLNFTGNLNFKTNRLLSQAQEKTAQALFQFLADKHKLTAEIVCEKVVMDVAQIGYSDASSILEFLKKQDPFASCSQDVQVFMVPQFRHFNFIEHVNDYQQIGGELSALVWAAYLQAPLHIFDSRGGIPRIISYHKTSNEVIPYLNYQELTEINTCQNIFSVKGLDFAMQHQITVTLAHILNPAEGTVIHFKEDKTMPPKDITNINTDNNQVQIIWEKLPLDQQVLAKIFSEFARNKINIDMISYFPVHQHLFNCSFTIPLESQDRVEELISQMKGEYSESEVTFIEEVTKINLIGLGMTNTPGVAANVFTVLEEAGIPLRMVTTSEIKISLLIHSQFEERSVNLLRRHFNLL